MLRTTTNVGCDNIDSMPAFAPISKITLNCLAYEKLTESVLRMPIYNM